MHLNVKLIAFIFYCFIATFNYLTLYLAILFVRKTSTLYDPGCKFTVEDSEISALSIHFHFNKLLSLLIKKRHSLKLWSDLLQCMTNALSVLFCKRPLLRSYNLLYKFLDVSPMYFLRLFAIDFINSCSRFNVVLFCFVLIELHYFLSSRDKFYIKFK